MSKLVGTLMLGAMLVALNLAAATAVAQEQPTTNDAVELFRAGERAWATRAGSPGTTPAQATQPARPGGPSGRPGILVAIGVLAAAAAAVTTTTATRRVRARQAV